MTHGMGRMGQATAKALLLTLRGCRFEVHGYAKMLYFGPAGEVTFAAMLRWS